MVKEYQTIQGDYLRRLRILRALENFAMKLQSQRAESFVS